MRSDMKKTQVSRRTARSVAYSSAKTGRSPKDKRVVKNPASEKDIWWGAVNIPQASPYFRHQSPARNTRERLYCFDGFAGWDAKYRLKVRVICSRRYHALFMHTMLIRPTREELASFGEPDFVIYNAGSFPANRLDRRHDLEDEYRPEPRGRRGRHPRHRVRRRDEEGRLYRDELSDAEARRALDALLGDGGQGDRAVRRCFSVCRAPARRRCRPTRSGI